MALALSFGATRMIGVVSRSIARLYRRFGLDLRNMAIGPAPAPTYIIACSIDLSPATFHKLRCDPLGLLDSVTRFGQLPRPEADMPNRVHPREAVTRSGHAYSEAPLAVSDNGTTRAQTTA